MMTYGGLVALKSKTNNSGINPHNLSHFLQVLETKINAFRRPSLRIQYKYSLALNLLVL